MQAERKCLVGGKFGLHMRVAGEFAEVAKRYRSSVSVLMGGREVDGKSILDMLTLGAAAGSELLIRAEGGVGIGTDTPAAWASASTRSPGVGTPAGGGIKGATSANSRQSKR